MIRLAERKRPFLPLEFLFDLLKNKVNAPTKDRHNQSDLLYLEQQHHRDALLSIPKAKKMRLLSLRNSGIVQGYRHSAAPAEGWKM